MGINFRLFGFSAQISRKKTFAKSKKSFSDARILLMLYKQKCLFLATFADRYDETTFILLYCKHEQNTRIYIHIFLKLITICYIWPILFVKCYEISSLTFVDKKFVQNSQEWRFLIKKLLLYGISNFLNFSFFLWNHLKKDNIMQSTNRVCGFLKYFEIKSIVYIEIEGF